MILGVKCPSYHIIYMGLREACDITLHHWWCEFLSLGKRLSRSFHFSISVFPFVFCLSLLPFMPWLSWNLHCKSGWPQANRDPPANVSWVLGLKLCATVPGFTSDFLCSLTVLIRIQLETGGALRYFNVGRGRAACHPLIWIMMPLFCLFGGGVSSGHWPFCNSQCWQWWGICVCFYFFIYEFCEYSFLAIWCWLSFRNILSGYCIAHG